MAFGCLPFAGFGSCTVNVTTHLPALRVLSFAATIAQFFLEELLTVIVTLAFGETIFTPTRLASVRAVYEFFDATTTAAAGGATAAAGGATVVGVVGATVVGVVGATVVGVVGATVHLT